MKTFQIRDQNFKHKERIYLPGKTYIEDEGFFSLFKVSDLFIDKKFDLNKHKIIVVRPVKIVIMNFDILLSKKFEVVRELDESEILFFYQKTFKKWFFNHFFCYNKRIKY